MSIIHTCIYLFSILIEYISGREKSPREVILHGIDPLARRFGRPLFNSSFDTTKHAAIRYKDYKLLTGKPGKYLKELCNYINKETSCYLPEKIKKKIFSCIFVFFSYARHSFSVSFSTSRCRKKIVSTRLSPIHMGSTH